MEKNSLTEGKILGPLLRFALPVLGSLVLQAAYGAVDLLIVGKYSTTADVSAVNTAAHIMTLITHMLTGLSMGTTILVGRNIGAGKKDEAGKAIGGAIVLFGIIGVVFSIFVPILANPLASLMKAPAEAFGKTIDYITVCGAGLFFVVAYNLLGSIFRGLGDSKTPLLSVFIACVLNIGGDIFFVKTLGLAAKGAALATVIAQGVSVIICFFIIRKRGLPFEFGKQSFSKPLPVIRETVKLGIPIALQSMMISLSFAVIIAIVNNIGVVESAGAGVADKVCAFIMLIPSSFSQALSAFVAQNMGAGKPDRAEKGLKYSILVSFGIAFVIFYIAFFHGYLLTSIFSNDPLVIAAGWDYLKAYALDLFFTSFVFCFIGYFNGLGRTKFVMLQGVLSAFCIRVPAAILMSKIVPVSLFKIGLATPAATFTQAVACLIFFRHLKKHGH